MNNTINRIEKHLDNFINDEKNHLESIINNNINLEKIIKTKSTIIEKIVFELSSYTSFDNKLDNIGKSNLFSSSYIVYKLGTNENQIKETTGDFIKGFNSQSLNKEYSQIRLYPNIIGIEESNRVNLVIEPNEEGLEDLIKTLCGEKILKKLDTFDLQNSLSTKNSLKSKKNKI